MVAILQISPDPLFIDFTHAVFMKVAQDYLKPAKKREREVDFNSDYF